MFTSIHDATQPSLTNVFIAGVAAGSVTRFLIDYLVAAVVMSWTDRLSLLSFITGPMELVKIQLQNQTHTTNKSSLSVPRYTGPVDCLLKIIRKGGIRACYTGLTPTILREISFGPYFVTFEVISRLLRSFQPSTTPKIPTEDDLSGWQVVLAGGSAGIMAWCSTYAAGKSPLTLRGGVLIEISLAYPLDSIFRCAKDSHPVGTYTLSRGHWLCTPVLSRRRLAYLFPWPQCYHCTSLPFQRCHFCCLHLDHEDDCACHHARGSSAFVRAVEVQKSKEYDRVIDIPLERGGGDQACWAE